MVKNIIITGATSFIASNFIKEIIPNDVHIYAIVRPQSKKTKVLPVSGKITVIEAEMKDYKMLDKRNDINGDVLFNFAWNGTRGDDRENALMQEANYEYSMDAVKACIKLGCTSIFSSGSQAEYGLIKGEITEDTICKPVTEYGKNKLRFYNEAKYECQKNHVLFVEPRFFSVYGYGDYEGAMIITVLNRMINNEPCDLTECTQKWDFLHVKDVVRGLKKLLDNSCSGGVYNFGSGVSKPLKHYIMEMYRITKSTSQLNWGVIPFSKSGIVNIEPNVEKLMKNCDWKPKISFEEGVEEIITKLKLQNSKKI